jgi:cadmium resistance protein CadD (predicted permease)
MTTDDAEARARIRSFLAPITLIVVSIPMLLNLVPRNWMYGVRTRETMASDAAWEAGNRLGALAIIRASVVWLLAATYLPRPYVKPVGIAALLLAVALLFMTQGWSI